MKKPGRKFYYFMAKFQGSGFSFPSLNQNIKGVVFPSNFWFQNIEGVVFPSNFWKTTIIWQFFRVILNFSQECYYLKNKVGVVVTNARGLVKFQSPRARTLPILGHLQNLLLPLYFWGNVSLPCMYMIAHRRKHPFIT